MRMSALLALLLAGFVASSSSAAPGALAGRWRIVAVAGAEGLDPARARAEFAANGRFASTIGCNRIAGASHIAGAALSFGPMIATRMACPPPLDDIERAYLAALQGVRGYRLTDGKLVLIGESGDALATLARSK